MAKDEASELHNVIALKDKLAASGGDDDKQAIF